jgi:hypothetical protein
MHARSAAAWAGGALVLVLASIVGTQVPAGADAEWPTLPAEWVRIDHNEDTSPNAGGYRDLPQGPPATGFLKYRVICNAQDGSVGFSWTRTLPRGLNRFQQDEADWQSPIWDGYRADQEFRYSFSVGGGQDEGVDCYLWGSRRP